jgi:hypothetical protein
MSKRAMDNERRCSASPTTIQLHEALNEVQRKMLPAIKSLGWELCFSRKRLFLDPMIVVRNLDDNRIGIFDYDGSIRVQEDIQIRKWDYMNQPADPNKPLKWTY